MKNDKGFSLMEVIVVIAILAILSTIVAGMVLNQASWQVKEAMELMKASIGETKTEAMSKNRASLIITRDIKGDYYVQITGKEKKKLGGGRMTISYTVKETAEETVIETGSPLQFSFYRSSGAFTPIIDGKNEDGSYRYRSEAVDGTFNMVYCNEIIIKSGSHRRELVLVRDTGKYYMK